MSYFCLDCGRTFEEGEERAFREPHGETWYGCPSCGGAYEKACSCEFCENNYAREYMRQYSEKIKTKTSHYWKKQFICNECFEKKLTYDNMIGFFEQYKNALCEFMFLYVYDLGCEPETINDELHKDLFGLLVEKIDMEKICGRPRIMRSFEEYVESQEEFLEYLIKGGEKIEKH